MDASLNTRDALTAKAEALKDSEPNFRRLLLAVIAATDNDDLGIYSAEVLESMLRGTYGRLGKRGLELHQVHSILPEYTGLPEILEIFSADMPFIVDSVLGAIRAKGGVVKFLSHPVLNLDPESHRLLDQPGDSSVTESVLIVHIEPLADQTARAGLIAEIEGTLIEVRRATMDWKAMLDRLKKVHDEWRANPPRGPLATKDEALAFLDWLGDHNFTFLGMREYRVEGEGTERKLLPLVSSGLGLLENRDFHFLRSGKDYVEMTEQHVAFLADSDNLMVTKANVKSRVHRRAYMDYIGIKLYREGGEVSGELRLIGLFTSQALATPHTDVPLVRRRVSEVMRRSGYNPGGHAGKALMAALDTYPRDELFQISGDLLFQFANLIGSLSDRPRVRVLPRIDRFDNFVSVLVYVPRDRYSSESRARIGEHLAQVYQGRVSAYYPHFPEGGDLVRVHFIIGRDGGRTPRIDRDDLEESVTALVRSFADRILALGPRSKVTSWSTAFNAAYQSRNTAEQAVADASVMDSLQDEHALALKLTARGGADGAFALKVYHRRRPIPLSDRVPMLENFGFRVIDERTFTVAPEGRDTFYIHEMVLEPTGKADGIAERAPLIEQAILAVWQNDAESDGLNQLTSTTGLLWHDVAILRALARYLRQIGVSYSRAYLAQVLNLHADVASALVTLFHALLHPGFQGNRDTAIAKARADIAAALDATGSLDEDRIIRRFLNLVDAAMRTNNYQLDAAGMRRPALAIKFDCHKVDGLPEPRPLREIFVYSPRVEGLHLRFGAIARGGLRWSDRPEDFRTEVLGLVKAQQVKNAIIVPVGAKGAFVPKQMPKGADREAVLREGTACYKIFVSTLLDVTDNLDGDILIPPPDVKRRDGDDPYLVVAADKGTASFSDTANSIALERRFWLGDAFASGGSQGYDHKKMGITARGAWEAVKRHFREIDRDIQASAFSVVGVGDMSGDVFGNGMLLSRKIRLIAAFDHRDIFIDPDPDPERSLAERQRLFNLPRSSWQDYNGDIISRGGGVYSRTLKNVPLFQEARTALGLGDGPVTPQDVMLAILKAQVDLLWFGGIGTYVRASDETDAEAGDKANDSIRVTARDIKARVVGEGANLGVTQRARVEFAGLGGRINSDAIDNSAGVNSSDLEVNIKIALASLVRLGVLDFAGRNKLLVDMTPEVAALCLRNNYLQPLAISLAQRGGVGSLPEHRMLIEALEKRNLLSRSVEYLPPDDVLDQRAAAGKGLTRPEIAVLLAYAKNALYADLLESKAPDDAYLGHELFAYFPKTLVEKHADSISGHRLRREVIATVIANQMINRGGPAFIEKLRATTNAGPAEIAAAFILARDAYGLDRLYEEIDALDGQISGATQLALYSEIETLLLRETLWLLRNADLTKPLGDLVLRYAEGVTDVSSMLSSLLPPTVEKTITSRAASFVAGGAPNGIARRFAELSALSFATDVAQVAERTKTRVDVTAGAYFGVLDLFGLAPIIEAGSRIILPDRFDRMALDRALANLMRAQRDLTADVLNFARGEAPTRLTAWKASRGDAIDRTVATVASLTEGEITVSRLSVAAGMLSDLARSA